MIPAVTDDFDRPLLLISNTDVSTKFDEKAPQNKFPGADIFATIVTDVLDAVTFIDSIWG